MFMWKYAIQFIRTWSNHYITFYLIDRFMLWDIWIHNPVRESSACSRNAEMWNSNTCIIMGFNMIPGLFNVAIVGSDSHSSSRNSLIKNMDYSIDPIWFHGWPHYDDSGRSDKMFNLEYMNSNLEYHSQNMLWSQNVPESVHFIKHEKNRKILLVPTHLLVTWTLPTERTHSLGLIPLYTELDFTVWSEHNFIITPKIVS